MPSSPLTHEFYGRLLVAMQHSQWALEYPRQRRIDAIRHFVGRNYGEGGTEHEQPVNLLSRYISIVGRNLIAKNPRVMLSTFRREQQPVVSAMEQWCNDEIERMYLDQILQRVVIDALFSVGVCKVAIGSPAEAALNAFASGAGMPYAAPVDLDDFVYDMHARDFRQCAFMGHRIRVPLEVVKDSKMYAKKVRSTLEASIDPQRDAWGERVAALSRGNRQALDDDFEPMCEIWEVYLPRHKKVLTFGSDQLGRPIGESLDGDYEPLREVDWVGPECGPYHVLGMNVVPSNCLPKSPIQDLVELHKWVNQLYRKLQRQSVNQKSLLLYANVGSDDADKIKKAKDGDCVPCDNPDRVVERGFRGPNQALLAMAVQGEKVFNEMAGNLDLLAGTATAAPTATQQSQMLSSASQVVSDMQKSATMLANSVVEALCWFWYHHPTGTMRSSYSTPSAPEIGHTRSVTPEQRYAIHWDDLKVKTDVFSMQPATPMGRLMSINQVMQLIQPYMAMAAQQGVSIDMNELLTLIGKYGDLPELKQILTTVNPAADGGAPDEDTMPQPTSGTRTYERVSRSEATKRGQDKNAVTSLMGVDTGGNPYESERNGSY